MREYPETPLRLVADFKLPLKLAYARYEAYDDRHYQDIDEQGVADPDDKHFACKAPAPPQKAALNRRNNESKEFREQGRDPQQVPRAYGLQSAYGTIDCGHDEVSHRRLV